MAEIIKNNKNFRVLKISKEEANFLGWGLCNGDCLCSHCNEVIEEDNYYPVVLNDTLCKKCYEEWYKDAENYAEDREYEERTFKLLSRLLNI